MRLKRIVSAGLSAAMISTMPMSAFAATDQTQIISDGGGHTIAGDIDYIGGSYALDVSGNNTSATVEGSVKADNGYGVSAGDDSTVNVKGDISAGKLAINSKGSSKTTVEGDVIGTGSTSSAIEADGKSTVTIKGDLISDNSSTMRIEDEAHLTVDGDIKAGNVGVSAWGTGNFNDKKEGENLNISVGGDVHGGVSGIDATNGTDITVGGNVTSDANGIFSAVYNPNDKNKDVTNNITVNGDVTVTTKDGYSDYNGVGAWNNSVIDIKGTVTVKDDAGKSPWAIWSEDSQVTVGAVDSDAGGIQAGGNNGKTAGIEVAGDLVAGDGYFTIQLWGSDASTVMVGNDVSSKNNGDITIDVADAYENSEIAIGGTIQNSDSELRLKIYTDGNGNPMDVPEIVIGEIADPDKIEIIDQDWDKVSEETKREVLDNIKYIVNTNPDSMEGKGTFTITKLNGDMLDRDGQDKYDVTKKSEQIVVRIAVTDGYEVGSFSAGKNNTYVRNADGSYTITVADGGGINIEAFIKAIENDPNPSSPKPVSGGSDSKEKSQVTAGSFIGTGAFATFKKADGTTAKNEWLNVSVNGTVRRCRFDENGFLTKGWYTENGTTFYFGQQEDKDYGFMYTGWNMIDGKWYYFMPYDIISGGETIKMGSMLKDTVTPDGYKVGSDGVYTE